MARLRGERNGAIGWRKVFAHPALFGRDVGVRFARSKSAELAERTPIDAIGVWQQGLTAALVEV